jgi:hypothetical protein
VSLPPPPQSPEPFECSRLTLIRLFTIKGGNFLNARAQRGLFRLLSFPVCTKTKGKFAVKAKELFQARAPRKEAKQGIWADSLIICANKI